HPERIFEVALGAAREAGLVGRRRVLDSTALYDAVATMDTVTLLRSGIRGLLRVAGEREPALRSLLRRDDDYTGSGKPVCDWEDPAAREALVDALAQDAGALLAALDGETLPSDLGEAAALLATLLGQDLETDDHGTFRIARRVAPDRIISTVDPDARHGHKTRARSFDGYKGHIAIDPDSEIVTATAVTPGNSGDAGVAPELLAADLPVSEPEPDAEEPPIVYADAAYGSGELLGQLETAGAELRIKVQPPTAPGGRFGKDDFSIDTAAGTVTCPAGRVAPLRARRHGAVATFGAACAACPLAARCTTAKAGRSISVGPHEASLVRARKARHDPAWLADYRATRPKVERRIAHLVRRRHGGRRARVRGRPKVAADFALLAAAVNLARLAVLGIFRSGPTWAVGPT
ncbi:MAG: transposase, partial [Chloroflexota bacterium]